MRAADAAKRGISASTALSLLHAYLNELSMILDVKARQLLINALTSQVDFGAGNLTGFPTNQAQLAGTLGD
jgi:hypothetical protein